MPFLTTKLAQEIVDRTMAILSRNINVMNERGIIIGSGDSERLSQLHDGALLVLERNETVEINEATAAAMKGAKPGINLPIRFNHQTVGVVGITGRPDDIRHYGQLVKMAAELVLEQSFLLEQMQWKQRLKDELVNQLLHDDDLNEDFLKERATILGIALDAPRIVIVIERSPENSTGPDVKLLRTLQYELLKNDLIATTFNEDIVILKEVPASGNIEPFLSRIQRHLKETGTLFKIASGFPAKSIKELKPSYQTAKRTINIGSIFNPDESVYRFEAYQFEVLLSKLKHDQQSAHLFAFYDRLLHHDKNGELQTTLQTYINKSGDLNEVAENLFIHRNTLRYRLDKMTEITGKDPRNIKDLLEMYTAKLLYELK